MSCNNSTAPIDIEPNKAKPCNLKCSYHFNYNNSSCNVNNKGEYLSFRYDTPSTPPVEYNNSHYTVHEVRVYTPSLHKYDGDKADAEIVIVHAGAGKNLLVCVPLSQSNTKSNSSETLKTILKEVKQRAPNHGESVSINMNNPLFNLNSFVPHGIPFYAYKGTIPYPPCNGKYDYVVFDANDYTAGISQPALQALRKILTKNEITTKPKNNVYYNKHGNPTGEGKSDDIYIECNPTGEDGRVLYESKLKSGTSDEGPDTTDILNNPFVKVAIGVVLSLIVFKGGKYIFNKLKKPKINPAPPSS